MGEVGEAGRVDAPNFHTKGCPAAPQKCSRALHSDRLMLSDRPVDLEAPWSTPPVRRVATLGGHLDVLCCRSRRIHLREKLDLASIEGCVCCRIFVHHLNQ